jgi:Group II intron, maturase-specific domain/Reverse transcriptase (RNA-dependent DNA polymerase)
LLPDQRATTGQPRPERGAQKSVTIPGTQLRPRDACRKLYHPFCNFVGSVVSPLLSNILLTPFDREMRGRGYQLTRYADDWVITCRSRREAEAALRCAEKILATLGVRVNPQKTRIVHVRQGFAFLGYKIKRGSRGLFLPAAKIKTGVRSGALYAYPTQKSVDRFKEAIRRKTQRRIPLRTAELIRELNPVIRGWGEYYKRAHVRRLFNQLDRWVVRRLWSHHHKRWRCAGWRTLPTWRLRGQLGLVSLISLIPSIHPRLPAVPSCKLHAGEPHVQFERRTEASASPGAPPPTRQARRRRRS